MTHRADKDLQDELLNSMSLLFAGKTNPALLSVLRQHFPSLSFALIVNWIPEQAEDIYFLLIDVKRLAVIEVPRDTNAGVWDAIVEIVTMDDYLKRRHSAMVHRKVLAALGLMRAQAES